MKKAELLRRIEALEIRIAFLEARQTPHTFMNPVPDWKPVITCKTGVN